MRFLLLLFSFFLLAHSAFATIDTSNFWISDVLVEGDVGEYEIGQVWFEVAALNISMRSAEFDINGEYTGTLAAGDMYVLADGTVFYVDGIEYLENQGIAEPAADIFFLPPDSESSVAESKRPNSPQESTSTSLWSFLVTWFKNLV